jgi:hypothetical protein
LGGGTSFFIESILSRYKKYQTFLIVRNTNEGIYFTVNDEYQFEKLYSNEDASNLLTNNKHKIEKIFVSHIYDHIPKFIHSLFDLNVKIDTITHDYYNIFNETVLHFNRVETYMNNNNKRCYIDINKYDNIITQNKGNLYIYNNFIKDNNKIIVSTLPDYKNPKEIVHTKNDNIVIGILGNISEIKGLNILTTLMDFYKNDKNIKFVVFGLINIYPFTNFYTYNSISELNLLLTTHKPNIIIELSITPETYSYTLSLAMITQLPILYLKKNNYCTVEDRLSKYNKAYAFTTVEQFNALIYEKKQDYFYTIEPIIYFNKFWDKYFITKKDKCLDTTLNNNVFNINTYCIYFPQFHEIVENNISFYKSYTDIINLFLLSMSNLNIETVTPLLDEFNINSIMNYDYVKNKQILQKQIDILYDYNISGFAIYYYWFSLNTVTNSNMLMTSVIDVFFNNLLDMKTKKVFFMWANESWSSNPAFGNTCHKIENSYSNVDNINKNIDILIKYFKHENYLKINNKPVFQIHHPWYMNESEINLYYEIFNNKCIENNFDGIYFILNSINGTYKQYTNSLHNFNYKKNNNNCMTYDDKKNQRYLDYKKYIDSIDIDNNENSIHTLVFDFDNRARLFKPDKLSMSTVCVNNTEIDKILFIKKIIEKYNKNKKNSVENILLINSWNEWGEKMAIEPSEEYGYYYLNLIKENLSEKQTTVCN